MMAVAMRKAVVMVAMLSYTVCSAEAQNVYLLSKRKIVNSNHTLVVLFHDSAITNIGDCHREIQRGNRGQWRFYQHKFPRPTGYSEKKDYLCIQSSAEAEAWYDRAPYDFVYQFDVRTDTPVIKKMSSLAECLRDLRQVLRDESRKFFCGKLSQRITLSE